METEKLASMVEVFEGLEDWRNAQQTRHVLSELLTVAVCAVLSGADDFEEVSQWSRERLDWLRGFLTLDYGVASPDTFERVFALLDPKGFEGAFRSWVGLVIPALGRDQVIAIDGKTSRRTTSKAAAAPLHMVSAFAANVGIVLGQMATTEKSNEIVCHERTRRQFGGCGVSPEMRVGPSKSAYRSRLQTATSCVGKEPSW